MTCLRATPCSQAAAERTQYCDHEAFASKRKMQERATFSKCFRGGTQDFYFYPPVAQRRSVARWMFSAASVCLSVCLSVCVFVSPHDNFRTITTGR